MSPHQHIQLEDQFGAHNYKPLDVLLCRGEGVWVKRYLTVRLKRVSRKRCKVFPNDTIFSYYIVRFGPIFRPTIYSLLSSRHNANS